MLKHKSILPIAGLVVVLGSVGGVVAQQNSAKLKEAASAAQEAVKTKSAEGAKTPSEAERIAALLASLEADKKRLEELNARLGEQNSEFEKAAEEFRKLDEELSKQKNELQGLRDDGQTEAVEQAEAAVSELEKKRALAKERLELVVQSRKTLQEQIGVLEKKIVQDHAALEKLTQPKPAETLARQPADSNQAKETPAEPAAESAAEPAAQTPGLPAAQKEAETETVPAAKVKTKETPKEVAEAEQELERTQEAAKQAEEELAQVEERLQTLSKDIDLERVALEAARKRADNAEETLETLRAELQQKSEAGAPAEELEALRENINDAQQRLETARTEAREHSLELDRLQTQHAELLAEQGAALAQAEVEQQRQAEAEKRLQALQNPFALRNVARWFAERGPKILFILLGAFLVHWLLRLSRPRLVRVMMRGASRESRVERENRAQTLVGAFYNAARIALYVGVLLMILDAAAIPIAPLLGGAAVVGLAIAFGAQNLIKDYFYGFMILLENQYSVNDVVQIAGIAGLVERIDLRMTVLRDLEGVVHFVPHGNVTTVSNMTHGWSRALFEIGVAYKEDMDRVMAELIDLGRELRRDAEFSEVILDDPEMLGVDAFGDSAVMIKFFIKTKPLQQWAVKRELLRRIKKRFDEIGIEIPFPHRTVYHRYETDGQREGAEIPAAQREGD